MAISTSQMLSLLIEATTPALCPALLLQKVCSASLYPSFQYLNVSIFFVMLFLQLSVESAFIIMIHCLPVEGSILCMLD